MVFETYSKNEYQHYIRVKRNVGKKKISGVEIDHIHIEGDNDKVSYTLKYSGTTKFSGSHEFSIKPNTINELALEVSELFSMLKNDEIKFKRGSKSK